MDWASIGIFVGGSALGAALTTIGQIVSTKLTQEKHSIRVKFVKWNPPHKLTEYDEDYCRAVSFKNTGKFIERDLEVRIYRLQQFASFSSNLQYSHRPLSKSYPVPSDQEDTLPRDYLLNEVWKFEFLSPGEETVLHLTASAPIIKLYVSVSNEHVLGSVEWDHEDADELENEVYSEVFGDNIRTAKSSSI